MTAKFDTSAYFAPQVGPPLVGEKVLLSFRSALVAGSHRAMVVAGPQTPATLRGLDLSDRAVFYIPAIGADSAARRQVLDTLYQGSRGVIVVADQDSAAFDRELQAARRATVPVVEGYMRQATADRWPWAVVVRAAQLRRLWSVLDLDEAQLRTTPAPLALEVPSTEAWFFPSIDSVSNVVTAPDVVGVLEGADSVLKKEYVIVNASLDASGPLALLALARAFSQPGARPPRSVLFVAASGAAPTYAGMWFVTNPTYWRRLAAFPPHRVAALTIGPLAPLPGDSLVIDGGADFTFGIAPVWIGAAHPELGVHAVDGGTAFQPETAGNAFARNSVPTLAFHGTGGKSAAAATGPSTPRDAERAAAALRLVFYVAQELANTTSPIQWTEAGRSRSIGASAVQP